MELSRPGERVTVGGVTFSPASISRDRPLHASVVLRISQPSSRPHQNAPSLSISRRHPAGLVSPMGRGEAHVPGRLAKWNDDPPLDSGPYVRVRLASFIGSASPPGIAAAAYATESLTMAIFFASRWGIDQRKRADYPQRSVMGGHRPVRILTTSSTVSHHRRMLRCARGG